MSTKSRIGAALLAAVTLGTAAIATSGEAQARHWGWGGVGLGIAAGAIIGAAAASSAYAEPGYYGPRCRWVRQYDAYGFYVGNAKVCRY